MKYFNRSAAMGAMIALALVGVSPDIQAAGKKKTSPAASPGSSAPSAASASPAKASPSLSPGTKMVRVTPFHGMISAVDDEAKTFTIAGKDKSRVFKLSEQSVITKAGAAATMKDVVAKEEVRGSYWRETDGTLMAKIVKVGPLTEQEKTAEAARKAKRAEKKAAKAAATTSASSSPSPSASASASPKP